MAIWNCRRTVVTCLGLWSTVLSTAATGSISTIMDYAENGGTPPSLADYQSAGVAGVDIHSGQRVTLLNRAVSEKTAAEVDTVGKLDELLVKALIQVEDEQGCGRDYHTNQNHYGGYTSAWAHENTNALTASKADGTLYTWGKGSNGGGKAPSGQFTQVTSTQSAFAALTADGQLEVWGESANGGNNAPTQQRYVRLFSTERAFAALTADGRVFSWGKDSYGGSGAPTSDGYLSVASNARSFAALHSDGSIVTWGHADYGGGETIAGDFTHIASSHAAYAALTADGGVQVWGNEGNAEGNNANAPSDDGYVSIFGSKTAFVALKADGSHHRWGQTGTGAPSSHKRYVAVATTQEAFAMLAEDGSIDAWGHEQRGGDDSKAPSGSGYLTITATQRAFAALHRDGSIAIWGHSGYGGQHTFDDKRYVRVFSNSRAFAALTETGKVIVWGDNAYGGNNAPSGSGFVHIASHYKSFAALKANGSVHTWGSISSSVAPPSDAGYVKINHSGRDVNRACGQLLKLPIAVIQQHANATTDSALTETTAYALGFNTINAKNAGAVSGALGQKSSSELDSLEKIQAIAEQAISDLETIRAYADNGTNKPTLSHYTGMGLSGVYDSNLADINALVEAKAGPDMDSYSEVQELVANYHIQHYADHGGTAPTLLDYQILGVAGIDINSPKRVALLNQAVASKSASDVDTAAKLNDLLVQQLVQDNDAQSCGRDYSAIRNHHGGYFNAGMEQSLHALTARKADGSLYTWGAALNGGGDAPTGQYTQVTANVYAFAALTKDGAIATWGDPDRGGDGAPTAHRYIHLVANREAFAALTADGRVDAWGDANHGGAGVPTQAGFKAIYANKQSFAALHSDGSIHTWGDADHGGGQQLPGNFTQVFASGRAYAAMTHDGAITVWGNNGTFGGNTSDAPSDNGYTAVFSGNQSFIALRTDGSYQRWGELGTEAQTADKRYATVVSNTGAFAMLSDDGSIDVWGEAAKGGDDSDAPSGSGFISITATAEAFAALHSDGSISVWGNTSLGGQHDFGNEKYIKVFSNASAFAAITQSGEITAWGKEDEGGSNPPAGTGFVHIASNYSNFAAIQLDGSIQTWGEGLSGTAAPSDAGYVEVNGSGVQRHVACAAQLALPLKMIKSYADDNTATAPSVTVLHSAGYTSADANNIGEIQAAISQKTAQDIQNSLDLKSLVDAAVATSIIKQYADNGGTVPTLAHYAYAGVSGVNGQNLNDINATVQAKSLEDVDTPNRLQTVVDEGIAKHKIKNYADNGGTAPTLSDYTDAAVAGVDSNNLDDVNAVISAKDSSQINTHSTLQAAINEGVAKYKIKNYADNGGTAPALADYADANVVGVTSLNLNDVNAAIFVRTSNDIKTHTKLQTAVDEGKSNHAVKHYADNGGTAPTLSDYANINVLGVNSQNLNEVNAAVGEKSSGDINTLPKLQAVVDAGIARDKIKKYADQGGTSPSLSDYVEAGITGVTNNNLSEVNKAIRAKSSADLNTTAQRQAVANEGIAKHKIRHFADHGGTAPTLTDYSHAGVGGVDSDNLNEVNTALASKSSGDVQTHTQLQNAANEGIARHKIKRYADNGSMAPTLNDYVTAGIGGVNSSNLSEVNVAIDASNSGEINTQAKLQNVADKGIALYKIKNYADNGGASPTRSDYSKAGVLGIDNRHLNDMNALVRAQSATELSGLTQIQGLANQVIAKHKIQKYADNNGSPPSLSDYLAAGVVGIENHHVDDLNNLVDSKSGAQVDELTKLQALANRVIASHLIQTYANDNTQPAPQLQHYQTLGLQGISANNIAQVNEKVAASQASDVNQDSELQALIYQVVALNKLEAYANSAHNPEPELSDYTHLGLEGVSASNLSDVNRAISQLGAEEVRNSAKLQSTIDRLNALATIQDYAQDNTLTPPSQADFNTLVTIDISTNQLPLLIASLPQATPSELATANAVQSWVSQTLALQAIVQYVADNTLDAPSIATYQAAKVNGVTASLLITINQGIAALAPEQINSSEKLQTHIYTILENHQASQTAIEKIRQYAENSENPAPTKSDFDHAGVSAVDSHNLQAVNQAIKEESRQTLDSIEKIQIVVQQALNKKIVLEKVIAYIQDPTQPSPELEDFTALGVTSVDADNLSDVQKALRESTPEQANTREKIQDLVEHTNAQRAALYKIVHYANDNNQPPPSLNDYQILGIVGLQANQLNAINQMIDGLEGSDVDTREEVQQHVQSILTSVKSQQRIIDYAQQGGNAPAPGLTDYQQVGLTSVDADVLPHLNRLLAQANIDKAEDLSSLEQLLLQARAYQRITNYARTQQQPVPSAEDFEKIGLTVPDHLQNALKHAIAQSTPEAVDQRSELQQLLQEVEAWHTVTAFAGDSQFPAPTLAHYRVLGLSPIVESELAQVNALVAQAPSSALLSPAALVAHLQSQRTHQRALDKIIAYASNESAPPPSAADYVILGLPPLNTADFEALNRLVKNAQPTQVDTRAELETLLQQIQTVQDSDDDGVPNHLESKEDHDGDGLPDHLDKDSDNDGINDFAESGLRSASVAQAWLQGLLGDAAMHDDALSLRDWDKDGINDVNDLDSDNDGLSDLYEAGGFDQNADGRVDAFVDRDGDGLHDAFSALPLTAPDSDQDGIANYLDRDNDNDGLSNLIELGLSDHGNDGVYDPQSDHDRDGIIDVADVDITGGADADADGIDDAFDVDFTPAPDHDNDGLIDRIDADDNNDGMADDVFNQIALRAPLDTDQDGTPDLIDLDSDGDGVWDIQEAGGTDRDNDGKLDIWKDEDRDNILDLVDIDFVQGQDVDQDGIIDIADSSITGAADLNGNGISDSYEPDARGFGFLSILKAQGGVPIDVDTDNNGIPDRLDNREGTFKTGDQGIGGRLGMAFLLALLIAFTYHRSRRRMR